MSINADSNPPGTITYRSNSSLQWGCGVLFFLIGSFLLMPIRAMVVTMSSLPGGRDDTVFSMVAIMTAAMCLLWGLSIVTCIGAARGLPQLLVDSTGMRLVTMFGVKWAQWSSLTTFVMSTVPTPRGGRFPAAKVRIVGPDVSRNLRRKPEVVVLDTFRTPLATMIDELNAARPRTTSNTRALAEAPPISTPSGRPTPSVGRKWLLLAMVAIATVTAAYRMWSILRLQ
jgi:hypothetical protein